MESWQRLSLIPSPWITGDETASKKTAVTLCNERLGAGGKRMALSLVVLLDNELVRELIL